MTQQIIISDQLISSHNSCLFDNATQLVNVEFVWLEPLSGLEYTRLRIGKNIVNKICITSFYA